ncbi:MAG: hypothetical protein RIC12_01670 [Pirellulales bacterium]
MANAIYRRLWIRILAIYLTANAFATLWHSCGESAPPDAPPNRVQRTLFDQSPAVEPLNLPTGNVATDPATWQVELGDDPNAPFPFPPGFAQLDLSRQTAEEAWAKSHGCVACHQSAHDPHEKETVRLGCCDCHGGNPNAVTKFEAHVAPRFPEAWITSANPVRSYTLLNHEAPEFVRFVNPGDLRIAHISCGTANCHASEVLENRKSMMTHGCMLWGAALYNNGAVPHKRSHYGESYSMHGKPLRLQTVPAPTEDEIRNKGVIPYLDPLPRFEMTQPGNILRIFERGGRFKLEPGIPEILEEPGRPRARLSTRGLGTQNRTDPVFIGLTKTRLLDPTLNFLGTNDHPGDYRSSGCTACHMVYANDKSTYNSGPYASFGNEGLSFSQDPMIPKNESGHPIEHRFTNSIPTSQCIVCHVHPGTTVMNSYLGFMWWDNETDGEFMYPTEEKKPTAEEYSQSLMSNPNEAAAKGLWSDPEFLKRVSDLNPALQHTQFASFNGHGWVYRAVFKKNRKGILIDHIGSEIHEPSNAQLQAAMDPELKCQEGVPVHLMDIHLEKGMHCVDCHFRQDVHGNTKLYGEVRAAIEIGCVDCHGTVRERTNLYTSGPAAPELGDRSQDPALALRPEGAPRKGHDLRLLRTPFGKPRFEERGDGTLRQNSMVDKGKYWDVPQTIDVVTPGHKRYNKRAALAKTIRYDEQGQFAWGDHPQDLQPDCLAHENNQMNCIACHSSWNPSCYGCHLPQKANRKVPSLHFEGDVSRNLVSYNFQTLRDDVYMLAKDGTATGNRIGPARSSCAIHVGSYNQNRESIYVQQQTISAEGLSGIAFSTNVPHTVRGSGPYETKTCSDCHPSSANDNNAILTQLLMQGTGALNFVGQFCWVAADEHGFYGVEVTERSEPQAVIGSTLHEIAYPESYEEHIEYERELKHAHEHPGRDIAEQLLKPFKKAQVLDVQNRGEYLYAACGSAGLRIFDVAFIDDKAFSERITSAPVSPIGQRFFVRTKYATGVAAPVTTAPDPTRAHFPENEEPTVHPLYGYIYVTDKYEGLILIGAGTLLDGIPTNNYIKRELTFNPNGLLKGAKSVSIIGHYAYVCCDAGLVVISLEDPTQPYVTSVVGSPFLNCPTAVAAQFRYLFVCDHDGLKIMDITDLSNPMPLGILHLEEAHNVYLARTYAYVAGGHDGLIIVDITNPEQPFVDQIFDAEGEMNDVHDVQLGITNVSQFAYVADGCHGLRVVQLTSPETPGNDGFSPRPTPRLVATYEIEDGHALAVARGVDRDRAVDESGSQISVFGRIGARPLNLEEQRKLYLRPDGNLLRVSDNPDDPIYGSPRSSAPFGPKLLPNDRFRGTIPAPRPRP